MAGLVPSLLLALFGAWCGTFAWGATWQGSGGAALSLLAVLAWAGSPWRDPLRLGGTGRLLPAALWIAVAASAWASPVPRAGWQAVVLLPAFLALPGTVNRCWRREADRRAGLRMLALVVAGVSLWALADWLFLDSPRAAMPLGHHNLLAAWMALLLPVASLPSREAGPWRFAGFAAAALATIAVLASRSLAGYAALALEVLLLVVSRSRAGRRRVWVILLALALVFAIVQLPRAWRIVSGQDPSSQARGAYLEAGLEGFRARAPLGWGPGAAPWTAAAFLDPIPTVNPWGEAVGELHSLPVQLGYELGVTGLLLALGLVILFFSRRIAERQEGRDPALLTGGLLGLAGGAVASLGSGAVAVTALPLAAAVAAGAALAGGGRGKSRPDSPAPLRIYAVAALIALLPASVAHWHYDRAVAGEAAGRSAEAEAHLAEAIQADPSFPLYPMRLALLRDRRPGERAGASGLALDAAEGGRGVPSLWLVAGILGVLAERPWAADALDRACALDPLAPLPPFYRLLADRTSAEAPRYGAHALLADPRLAAARFWEANPALYARTLEAVRAWPEVDAGWKEALLAAPPPTGRRGPFERLTLGIDTDPRQSLSLPVFRRRPWPVHWGLLQVRQDALVALPPAAASPGTAPDAFRAIPCRRRSLNERWLLIP
ncbi:MAG TPA: O-antigen ligase family protein [Thermoanaerobaculia bacterium]|nr:O-antigen ligase family protein [Thermoanaerobaculia bacterium]